MNIEKQYREKLMSADEAVKFIPAEGVISMGMRLGTPPALCAALAERARRAEIKQLKIYYMRCGDVALQTIFQEDLLDIIRPYSSMLTTNEVKLAAKGFLKNKKYIHYVPISFSQYPKTIMQQTKLDAFMVTVTPMDEFGYFNLGVNGDYAIELSRYANKLIVEVNEHLPRTSGLTSLHISEVDAIIENHQMFSDEEKNRPISVIDAKVCENILELIPDATTFQIGIGGIPNALCELLKERNDLGVHTEVMTSGIIDLIKLGVVTNAKKTLHPHLNIFTFAAGNKSQLEFINNNPSMHCMPVSYVNDPRVIAKNKNIVSVNSFVEIDFSGQVNAEFIGHQYSGIGGQLDFIRGVSMAEKGVSILASRSTVKQDQISCIVPRLNSVATDTRVDVDCVVTEYGRCHLKGKSTSERTLALISIAHPKFRDELMQKAREQSFI